MRIRFLPLDCNESAAASQAYLIRLTHELAINLQVISVIFAKLGYCSKTAASQQEVCQNYEPHVRKGWLLRLCSIIPFSFHLKIYDGISILVYIRYKDYTFVQVYTGLIPSE
jgi:hypothetical protein